MGGWRHGEALLEDPREDWPCIGHFEAVDILILPQRITQSIVCMFNEKRLFFAVSRHRVLDIHQSPASAKMTADAFCHFFLTCAVLFAAKKKRHLLYRHAETRWRGTSGLYSMGPIWSHNRNASMIELSTACWHLARLIRAKKTHCMDLILSILAASVCNLWLVEFEFEGYMRCRQLLVHSAPIWWSNK